LFKKNTFLFLEDWSVIFIPVEQFFILLAILGLDVEVQLYILPGISPIAFP